MSDTTWLLTAASQAAAARSVEGDRVEQLVVVLGPIMKAIAAAIGPHCEVVLHDVSRGYVEHTVVAIENGHVTDRRVGSPPTDRGLEFLRQGTEGEDEFGYVTRTRTGRELRSSSVYYHGADGEAIAILCINVDMTPLLAAQLALEDVVGSSDKAGRHQEEVFANDILDLLDSLIEQAVSNTGKTVPLMDRDDKLAVLRFLDQKGAFFIKRSVELVARRLNVSRGAAYRYLDEVRSS